VTDVKPDQETLEVTVNGELIVADPGELLIAACERNGIYIPRFCYHPRMTSVGMCRMCIVEVDTGRGPSLQPSCMLSCSDGMTVETESEVTKKAQDGVLEFLLINHPLDCPVCDKGGECPLQDQTVAYGPGESRFVEEKRHFEKPIPISDTVYLDRERCILCDRCTRFADEVAGDALIHFMDRGANTEVNTFPGEPFSSYFSGNTVEICPVGALTAKPYRFKARPWDLEETTSTAWVDSVGARITVQSSRNQVLRVLGVDADPVNWGWLSDKERFGFEALNHASRLSAPVVRNDDDELVPTGWADAFGAVVDEISGLPPERIAILGGARLTNEAQYAWTKLAKGVLATDNVDAQLDDGLPAHVILGFPRATIDDACRPGGTVILVGPDPKEELGTLYLRLRHAVISDGVTLIEMTPRTTGLSGLAAHALRPRPGELGALATAFVAATEGDSVGESVAGVGGDAINAAAAAVGGPVTVLLGRASLAESAAPTVEAATALRRIPGVSFLSALRRGNIHGALDMGMAPGLLPGRVDLTTGRDRVEAVWPRTPERPGLDAAGILQAAAAGDIDVLVLLGADPLNDFPDRDLAARGLGGAGFVVAVDLVVNDSSDLAADVVLAAAAPTEVDGTFTNLEGRVSVMRQKVTPPGTARADWLLAVEISARLGTDLGFESLEAIRAEIAAVSAIHVPMTESALRDTLVDGLLLTGRGDFIPPAATASVIPVNDAYSLRLVAIRSMYDDGVMLRGCPSSRGLVRAMEIRLNPADFDPLGVEPGTGVVLQSAAGELEGPVHRDPGVPRGSAVIPWAAAASPANELMTAGSTVTDVRVERL
jgi:NADH-quinone oxidoreductase subunit G